MASEWTGPARVRWVEGLLESLGDDPVRRGCLALLLVTILATFVSSAANVAVVLALLLALLAFVRGQLTLGSLDLPILLYVLAWPLSAFW